MHELLENNEVCSKLGDQAHHWGTDQIPEVGTGYQVQRKRPFCRLETSAIPDG